jgi:MtN3 and saliva related transmembrane protein
VFALAADYASRLDFGEHLAGRVPELSSYVGGIAAILASLSYIPQERKAWPLGSTKDFSLGMLTALTLLRLGIVYGVLRGDWVIDTANAIGSALAAHLPWLPAT